MDRNKINKYCTEISEQESDSCKKIRALANERFPDWAMMVSGGLENAMLKFLLKLNGAKSVLEVGTFVGYSALSMAEALPSDGRVVTLDINDDFVSVAKEIWPLSEAGKKIELILGPALEYMEKSSEKFDMIFIDADKENYIKYFEQGLKLLNSGGMIAVDNALWSGRVLAPEPSDVSSTTIANLNKLISERKDLQSVLLPVRDGLHLVMKK